MFDYLYNYFYPKGNYVRCRQCKEIRSCDKVKCGYCDKAYEKYCFQCHEFKESHTCDPIPEYVLNVLNMTQDGTYVKYKIEYQTLWFWSFLIHYIYKTVLGKDSNGLSLIDMDKDVPYDIRKTYKIINVRTGKTIKHTQIINEATISGDFLMVYDK